MAKLSLPSRKVLANHLQSDVSPNQSNHIWLQGNVADLLTDENSFLLDDGSATVKVCKSSQVVQACSQLTTGKYVLVIGEIQNTGNLPLVKAIKIQDLSDQPILQEMWKYEVMDFLNYTASK